MLIFKLFFLFCCFELFIGAKENKNLQTKKSSVDEKFFKEGNLEMRKKQLDFEEGSVVEGLNQNPFDSLTNLKSQEGFSRKHLYQYKKNFISERNLKFKEIGLNL